MGKMFLALTLTVTAAFCCGETVPVEGRFVDDGAGGVRGWKFNAPEKSKPLGDVVSVMHEGMPGVRLASKGKRTSIYQTLAVDVAAGEEMTLSAKVRGTGRCALGFFQYGGKWEWKGSASAPSVLASNGKGVKDVVFRLTVPEGVNKLRPYLDANAGATAEFYGLKLERGTPPPAAPAVKNAVDKKEAKEEPLPLVMQSISRMESRTTNKKREPGLFGDYWWANRFLSRHRLIESFRGGQVDLVLIGDSITHFWEWGHDGAWKRLTEGRRVLNLGYGGDGTQNVIWRIEHGELDGYEAKIVVLMIGTNNNSGQRNRPEDVARATIKIAEMVHEHQPKAKLILHPIFPRGAAETPENVTKRDRNARTSSIVAEYARRQPWIEWVDFNDRLVDATGWVPKEIMADGLHPTEKGYDIWREALEPYLR